MSSTTSEVSGMGLLLVLSGLGGYRMPRRAGLSTPDFPHRPSGPPAGQTGVRSVRGSPVTLPTHPHPNPTPASRGRCDAAHLVPPYRRACFRRDGDTVRYGKTSGSRGRDTGAGSGTGADGFKRALTTPLLYFFILGDVLGAGVYVLVGQVAADAGERVGTARRGPAAGVADRRLVRRTGDEVPRAAWRLPLRDARLRAVRRFRRGLLHARRRSSPWRRSPAASAATTCRPS